MQLSSDVTFSTECGAQLSITPGQDTPTIELSINQASIITDRQDELNFRNSFMSMCLGDEKRVAIAAWQVNHALRVHLQYCLDADLLHFMAVMAATFNRWSDVIICSVTDLLEGLGFNNEAVATFREAVRPFAEQMEQQYA